eukprot:TRINITY_DN5047_c0_g2_i1.p1 TRINITY_DN5047_c0_g2~~TRINITY_DN5047_c0_g2_i1.p1  ORF type:complete len:854 (-),score=101.99 TRINITY_DN5047_c0_g2_i1:6-2531(-)
MSRGVVANTALPDSFSTALESYLVSEELRAVLAEKLRQLLQLAELKQDQLTFDRVLTDVIHLYRTYVARRLCGRSGDSPWGPGALPWAEIYAPSQLVEFPANFDCAITVDRWLKVWGPSEDDEGNPAGKLKRGRRREDSCHEAAACEEDVASATAVEDTLQCRMLPVMPAEYDMPNLRNYNAVMLAGPTGCGKTAIVHSCCAALGYKVIEINPSVKRTGRHVLSTFREATQSYGLAMKQVDAELSFERLEVEQALESRPKKRKPALSKESLAKFFGSPKQQSTDQSPPKRQRVAKSDLSSPKNKAPQASAPATPLPSSAEVARVHEKTLILFDEADVAFEDETGFVAALKQLIADNKCPIAVTCTEPPAGLAELSGVLKIDCRRSASLVRCITGLTEHWGQRESNTAEGPECNFLFGPVLHVLMVLLAEGVDATAEDCSLLLRTRSWDLRSTLLHTQLWLQAAARAPVAWPGETKVDSCIATAIEHAIGVQGLRSISEIPLKDAVRRFSPHQVERAIFYNALDCAVAHLARHRSPKRFCQATIQNYFGPKRDTPKPEEPQAKPSEIGASETIQQLASISSLIDTMGVADVVCSATSPRRFFRSPAAFAFDPRFPPTSESDSVRASANGDLTPPSTPVTATRPGALSPAANGTMLADWHESLGPAAADPFPRDAFCLRLTLSAARNVDPPAFPGIFSASRVKTQLGTACVPRLQSLPAVWEDGRLYPVTSLRSGLAIPQTSTPVPSSSVSEQRQTIAQELRAQLLPAIWMSPWFFPLYVGYGATLCRMEAQRENASQKRRFRHHLDRVVPPHARALLASYSPVPVAVNPVGTPARGRLRKAE